MGRGKKIVDIELVIDEAIALIEEVGVEEFSTRRLASRLGISAMTLYNYYDNRGAILKGAFAKGLGMLWKGQEGAASPAGRADGLGAYRALADHVLAFALERPKLCRFLLSEGAGVEGSSLPHPAPSREAYLFELLICALALKVTGGAETPERYRELAASGFDLLLAGRGLQSST